MTLLRFAQKTHLILAAFIIAFIAIRLIHFPQRFNFAVDQADHSIKALEIWRDKKIELVGPPLSIRMGARYIFTSSVTYYVQLVFLVLGGFDPLLSTALFVLAASLSIVPLYFGVLWLTRSFHSAVLVVGLYTFLPFFANYSSFFWNPTFQFVLSPGLLFLLGLFHQKKSNLLSFLVGFYSGFLLLFHYQFVLVMMGVLVYVWIHSTVVSRLRALLALFAGMLVGFSPLLLFELRNDFYNIRTMMEFATHWQELRAQQPDKSLRAYYFLSLTLPMATVICNYLKNVLSTTRVTLIITSLALFALLQFLPVPHRAFGATTDWSYPDELKVYELIRMQNLSNYAVVNLGYDNLAAVQRYLHTKDEKADLLSTDYYTNEYLFVVSSTPDFMSGQPPYEVGVFQPSEVQQSWEINEMYDLYLLKKTVKEQS